MSDDPTLRRKEVRAEVATRGFIVFVISAVVVTLSLLTVLTVQGTQRGKDNRATLLAIQANSAIIKSCTTPGQTCYERGKRQTGRAVASINQVVILAAACAVGETGPVVEIQTEIQACVINRLAAAQAKR